MTRSTTALVMQKAREKQETKTNLQEEGVGMVFGKMGWDYGKGHERLCLSLRSETTSSPYFTMWILSGEVSSRGNGKCKGPEA